ncbi:MAG: aldo/keto reductase [Oscillospiraceae bacterium]|nr:aldo/keto reductase [Oscillospiraceae bacterium]
MQYRIDPKTGKQVSLLAFGYMRSHKDLAEAERHVRYAIEQGVNYFDTAYVYPGSEAKLGTILAKDGLRARVNIATKLPYYLVRKREDFDKLFNTQLERLQTDYIDYYMVHMLPSPQSWRRLCDLGIIEWVQAKQAEGKIRQFGFSFHGTGPDFQVLIDAFDWDFTMIQYNYYDVNFQAGRQGLYYAAERGIPVMVMEPLRGGTLVHKLPPDAKAVWDNAPGEETPAAWALRWVFDHPEVLTALSGMGIMEMVEENVRVASKAQPNSLTAEEQTYFDRARTAIQKATKVPCTSCGYCMPCPAGVDIPLCFNSLNDTVLNGRWKTQYWYVATAEGHNAARCIHCGKCEPLCPQGIPIQEKLGQVERELERFPYRPMRLFVRRILKNQK